MMILFARQINAKIPVVQAGKLISIATLVINTEMSVGISANVFSTELISVLIRHVLSSKRMKDVFFLLKTVFVISIQSLAKTHCAIYAVSTPDSMIFSTVPS